MALPLSILFKGGAFFISASITHTRDSLSPVTETGSNFYPTIFSIFRRKTHHFITVVKIPLLTVALLFSLSFNLIGGAADKPPIRVVSLAPSLTEIICEVGASQYLVGITTLCDYPPENLKGIPTVGSIGSFSAEKILSLKPDIVFAINSSDRAIKVLKKAGVKVIYADPQSIEDIKNTVILIGKLLGKQEQSQKVVKEMEDNVKEIKANSLLVIRGSGRRQKIYIEIYYPPPWSASYSSFIGEAVELMGFQNIFHHNTVGRKNYFPVAPEEIIAARPDVILVLSGDEGIKTRRGFEGLPAVKNNRVVIPYARSALVRATPRMIREMLRLQKEQIIPLIR